MWSSKKSTVNVYFVLTDGGTDIETTTENMQLAFQVSEDVVLLFRFLPLVCSQKYVFTHIIFLFQECYNHGLETTVISETEVCSMKLFKKSQVFVYDQFEGPAFQHVLTAAKQNKAVLVQIFNLHLFIYWYCLTVYYYL